MIAFLVAPEFDILNLAGPLAAFETVRSIDPSSAYSVKVVSVAGGDVRSSCEVVVRTADCERLQFDTLIAVDGQSADIEDYSPVAGMVRRAAHSRRLAAISGGIFVLASAGILDAVRVTTSWNHARKLKLLYPGIKIDLSQTCIKDGRVWSAAGASTSIDLALALIAEDHGEEMPRAVAAELSVEFRRATHHPVISTLGQRATVSHRIRDVLAFCRAHIGEDLTVNRLAAHAHLSRRQFSRLFAAEIGTTPAKAVERLRSEAARQRVETGEEPLQSIAQEFGFVDLKRMRRAFIRVFGHPPQSIRREGRLHAWGTDQDDADRGF